MFCTIRGTCVIPRLQRGGDPAVGVTLKYRRFRAPPGTSRPLYRRTKAMIYSSVHYSGTWSRAIKMFIVQIFFIMGYGYSQLIDEGIFN